MSALDPRADLVMRSEGHPAPTAVGATIERLAGRAFIDGQLVEPLAGGSLSSTNPATGAELTRLASCQPEDVDRAVVAARQSFDDRRWLGRSPVERKRAVLRLAELLEDHLHELATLDTLEVGKPIRDTVTSDLPKTINMYRWYAEAIDKIYGAVAPTPSTVHAFIVREPLGVIGAVTPWNFPLYVAAYKIAPALVTGNSIVHKPAEQSTLSALRVAELALEAGIPPGVLNVTPGVGEITGRAIGVHMDVDAVAFTGSAEVGKAFLRYAGESNMKKVQIEAGGKSAHIVLDDAPAIDHVALQAAWGIFYNQGQVCSAGSRLVVHERIKDELLERIRVIAAGLQVGDPIDPTTDLGAIVSEHQLERVSGYVQRGLEQGAKLVMGGRRTRQELGGYFFEPTIFDAVENTMVIAQEEIFGPVLSVISVADAEQAIRVANTSEYGLGAAVWTRDITTALHMASRLRAGQVWVNNYDQSDITVPWGGFRRSGLGRDKSLHAFDEYTAPKATWIEIRP